MLFAKNIGKNLSNRFGQKLLDSAKKSTVDAIKTASKREIQKKKTAEATCDLISDKVADKITSVSKKSPTKLHLIELHSKELQNDKTEAPKKKIHMSRRKKTNY